MQHFIREAERLRCGRWLIRPLGALGTCGFYPYPWEAISVRAPTQTAAKLRAGLDRFTFRANRQWFVFQYPDGTFVSDIGPARLEDAGVFCDSQTRFRPNVVGGVWKALLPSGELAE